MWSALSTTSRPKCPRRILWPCVRRCWSMATTSTERRRRELKELFATIQSRFRTVRHTLAFGPYRIRILRLADPDALLDQITEEEFQQEERLPYWAELWPSSIGLARHIWRWVECAGQPVLELGCGLGLAGLIAAQKGGEVTFTDYEPDALLFARYHALLNRCPSVHFRLLDWRHPDLEASFPWVIASDVLYEKQNVSLLFSCVQRFLLPGGTFILADPYRPAAAGFFRLMAREGYRLRRTVQPVTLDQSLSWIGIYEFTREETGKGRG
ncbi:MAG: methyltransferase domain-containing protein [Nitrospinota bacterium]|nr:MAG: methyltransferase domain-containing protein [Nitrospinota bacterium]